MYPKPVETPGAYFKAFAIFGRTLKNLYDFPKLFTCPNISFPDSYGIKTYLSIQPLTLTPSF